jgi:hypothetical protein
MYVAQYDRAPFMQGSIRHDSFTPDQRAHLKLYVKGIVSMAYPERPEQADQVAAGFCQQFDIPVSNCDPFGTFLSFVGGVNDDWKPLGECALYSA